MSRRQAREAALQSLFQLDLNKSDTTEGEDRQETLAIDMALGESERMTKNDRNYVDTLVRGTRAHMEKIDEEISACSSDWKLERMAAVDRNIVRMAVFELFYAEPSLSPGIVINEAVDLAKKFGSDDSGRYVNGVLGTVVKRHA